MPQSDIRHRQIGRTVHRRKGDSHATILESAKRETVTPVTTFILKESEVIEYEKIYAVLQAK